MSKPASELLPLATDLTRAVFNRLQVTTGAPSDSIAIEDGYVGRAYGQPTAGMIEALQLAATQEGLVFDPVYTGKALAGLVDLIRTGHFAAHEKVVFIHTGGVPALFACRTAFGPA